MRIMKKVIAGFGMSALKDPSKPVRKLPVSRLDLARMGIPARKIPRVMLELQRASDADPSLEDRVTLLHLARAFAAMPL